MDFIKPKARMGTKTNWSVSDRTKSIVKYYAEYTGLSEEEVVDQFLTNILKDEDFNNWINSRRRKTRITKQLFPDQNTEEKAN